MYWFFKIWVIISSAFISPFKSRSIQRQSQPCHGFVCEKKRKSTDQYWQTSECCWCSSDSCWLKGFVSYKVHATSNSFKNVETGIQLYMLLFVFLGYILLKPGILLSLITDTLCLQSEWLREQCASALTAGLDLENVKKGALKKI